MATNVLLVFWRGYDATQLRHLEKWYMLLAYGVPAIPPIIYVILDHQREVPILGPATVSLSASFRSACTNHVAMVLGCERFRLDAYCVLLRACVVSSFKHCLSVSDRY
jgi:hypothetical protein